MQARYYDPVIGRFLSIDPVTFMDTGNPSQFIRYAYANNDPINMLGPDGERAWGFNFDVMVVPGGGARVGGEIAYDTETKQLRVMGVFGPHYGAKVKGSANVFVEPSSDRPDSASYTATGSIEGTAKVKVGPIDVGINPTAAVDATLSTENGLSGKSDLSLDPSVDFKALSADENGRTSLGVGGGLGVTVGIDHKVDINISLDYSWMDDLLPLEQR